MTLKFIPPRSWRKADFGEIKEAKERSPRVGLRKKTGFLGVSVLSWSKGSFILNSSVDHHENGEYLEKNNKLLNIMGPPDGCIRFCPEDGMTRRGETCLAPTCRHRGASSNEGAFSTARCRASMPDLPTEEFRFILNSSVDHDENSEYIEKTMSC
jgi:hypothetical protein